MKEKRKESIIMPAKKKHPVRLEELTWSARQSDAGRMEITYIKRNRKNRRSDYEKEASDWKQ